MGSQSVKNQQRNIRILLGLMRKKQVLKSWQKRNTTNPKQQLGMIWITSCIKKLIKIPPWHLPPFKITTTKKTRWILQSTGRRYPFHNNNETTKHTKTRLEPRKKPSYLPLNPGWLIGILIMAYYNPYITGQYFSPCRKNPKQPRGLFFIAHLVFNQRCSTMWTNPRGFTHLQNPEAWVEQNPSAVFVGVIWPLESC